MRPSQRAVVFGLGDAGPLACSSPPRIQERTTALVLMNSSPRFVRNRRSFLGCRASGGRLARDESSGAGAIASVYEDFGRATRACPRRARAPRPSLRLSVSPGSAAAYVRMNPDVDVCDVLPADSRSDSGPPPGRGPGGTSAAAATWRTTSGRALRRAARRGLRPDFGDQEQLFSRAGVVPHDVRQAGASAEPDRVLATGLFTDIVGATSTGCGARRPRLARAPWSATTRSSGASSAASAARKWTRPATASSHLRRPRPRIRCAGAIVDSVFELGLEIRAGLHTGECELVDGKVAGIAVHTGARVASHAKSGEVLVSRR